LVLSAEFGEDYNAHIAWYIALKLQTGNRPYGYLIICILSNLIYKGDGRYEMSLLDAIDIRYMFYYFLVIVLVFFIFRGMFRMVVWAKKMPKGAFIFLAIFPLISIFPIPGQEIKKLEKIKQVQVKHEDESGDPPNDNISGV
jgi:predicted permease